MLSFVGTFLLNSTSGCDWAKLERENTSTPGRSFWFRQLQPTTLQSMMHVKLSLHGFWHCQKKQAHQDNSRAFLGVLAKTQCVQNAKTQFESAKTQFQNAKTQFEN